MTHPTKAPLDADVIVVGGGFAGVVAAREVAAGGHDVLLLEARDRLGGRVWTREYSDADFDIEIGGTWVLPGHEAILAEMQRYGVQATQTRMPEHFVTRIGDDDVRRSATPGDSALSELAAAMRTSLSAAEADADSLAVVAETVGLEARVWLDAWTSYLMGAPLDQTSGAWRLLLDRAALQDIDAYSWKVERGAQMLFASIARDGAFGIAVNTPVASVRRTQEGVQITDARGDTFSCALAIIAVPVNTWGDIAFDPPLAGSRARLADERQPGRSVKVWMIVDGVTDFVRTVDPFGGFAYLRTERLLPDGRALMVGFSHADAMPEVNEAVVADALRRVIPEATLVSIDAYDWNSDPYARGTWMAHKPGQWVDALACEGRDGPLIFAGADIDHAAPGTIDGAVRSGLKAGRLAREALEAESPR
ncbi:NAD(P)/FAD-dependent oxidoreductase [Microbacterium lacus]